MCRHSLFKSNIRLTAANLLATLDFFLIFVQNENDPPKWPTWNNIMEVPRKCYLFRKKNSLVVILFHPIDTIMPQTNTPLPCLIQPDEVNTGNSSKRVLVQSHPVCELFHSWPLWKRNACLDRLFIWPLCLFLIFLMDEVSCIVFKVVFLCLKKWICLMKVHIKI